MKNSITYKGLSPEEIEKSRKAHGSNIISKSKKKSFLAKFAENLGDPVIKILIGALFFNLLFTFRNINWIETAGIAISVFLATFISTVSEYGSEAAFSKLQEEGERIAYRVIRSGGIEEIEISDIVAGDIVLLEAGEKIPADGIIIEGGLSLDQSAFSGEGREIEKVPSARKQNAEKELKLSDSNSLFRGCTVLSGEGVMEVTRVGDATFYGTISKEMQEDTRESPLKIRLKKLAGTISVLGYIAAALIAIVYLANAFFFGGAGGEILSAKYIFGELLHALTLAVTVIVVAVPEGLPMMIAVVLSSNIKKMVRDNVLVRKLVGIESAGSMNILFTDKTGTLTEGKLSVSEIFAGDGSEYKTVYSLFKNKPLFSAFEMSARYNTSSSVGKNGSAIGGNSTDRALLHFVSAKKTEGKSINVVSKIPFDSAKKYSAVTLSTYGKGYMSFIKGAPEKILPHIGYCINGNGDTVPFTERERLVRQWSVATANSERVIALAFCNRKISGEADFSALTLIALVCLKDKLRFEAKSSVKELRRAGIQVVMITGDNKDTAVSIAKAAGIMSPSFNLCLTSEELARMDDKKLGELLPRLCVVARALPTDKSRLVRIAQEKSLVVGMTGDGVNDAPALKRADIGFAMGSGVSAAKEAGDIIILDNNLASIVKAVLYGRNIFKSIRKFIVLQLTMNFCAVGISMIGPFIGVEEPVTVVQMLWINIIMDTLGGLAFAGEPALSECMLEKPKRRDEPILNSYMINQILFLGGATVALCVAFLKTEFVSRFFRVADDNIYLLTAFFAFFIFAGVFNCFNAHTNRLNVFANLSKNKPFITIMIAVCTIQLAFVYLGGSVLRTVPLTSRELAFTFAAALLVFPIDALRKIFFRIFSKDKGKF